MTSILPRIDAVYKTVEELCASIHDNTNNKELRQEYETLCHQIKVAIQYLHRMADTQEYINKFSRQ